MKNNYSVIRLILPVLLFCCVSAHAEEGELDSRVERLERRLDSNILIDMSRQLEALRKEVRNLRGDLEEQGYTLDQMKKRQQNLFDDLDSRLQALENDPDNETLSGERATNESVSDEVTTEEDFDAIADSTEDRSSLAPENELTIREDSKVVDASERAIENANAIVPVESFSGGGDDDDSNNNNQPSNKSVVISSGEEEASYSEAFNTLKEGQHDESIEKFRDFIQQHPSSKYADNAQYWIGEAYYAQRRFEPAIEEYQKLLEIYPDSGKASHALLKIGYSYHEMGETDLAESELESLSTRYPGTTAATLAEQRLNRIRN